MEYLDKIHIRFTFKTIQTHNGNDVIKAIRFNLDMVWETLKHGMFISGSFSVNFQISIYSHNLQ